MNSTAGSRVEISADDISEHTELRFGMSAAVKDNQGLQPVDKKKRKTEEVIKLDTFGCDLADPRGLVYLIELFKR